MITGGTGLLGAGLTVLLNASGYTVAHLSRKPRAFTVPAFAWDIPSGKIDKEALRGRDAIIHLAGAGVADRRWSTGYKEEIRSSRIQSTSLLYDALSTMEHQVKTVVCASAIGYYGFGMSDAWVDEDAGPGTDFLSSVVVDWEQEQDRIASLGIRVVKIRVGIVLSRRGGALSKLMLPVSWGVGAPLASGRQWMSWIHEDDLLRMFVEALEKEQWRGAVNGVAPVPVTNLEMTKTLAQTLHRPLWLPAIPPFVLKVIVGEMADMVINGSRVSATKAIAAGFKFNFGELPVALNHLLSSFSLSSNFTKQEPYGRQEKEER